MLIDEIRSGESDRLEFKIAPNRDSGKWLKTVVAFANCRGGRILFGVANDRTVPGLTGDIFAQRDAIVNAIADSCSPSPDTIVNLVNVEGVEIISLEVLQGRHCPYFLKSQGDTDGVYVRYDATTRKADPDTVQELRLDGAGIGYDAVACRGIELAESEVENLCLRMYGESIERAPSQAHRELVRRVTRAQLRKWGVIVDRGGKDEPSNAYALLTGNELLKTQVKCAVFRGSDRSVFLDRHPISGSVIDLVNESYLWVLSKLNVAARIEGTKRVDVYEIPPAAIRELIVNAVVHRSYVDGMASPISVAIYDDRLEITSPGGLTRSMTIQKMLGGHSDCRNKVLAHAFEYMFFVENWGTGMQRICRLLADASLPPLEIEDFGTSIRMIIRRKCAAAPQDAPQNTPQNTPQSAPQSAPQTTPRREPLADRVMALVEQCPMISARGMADRLGVGYDTVREYIAKLKKKGRLFRVGPDNGGHWESRGGKS